MENRKRKGGGKRNREIKTEKGKEKVKKWDYKIRKKLLSTSQF